ncbi:MAG: RIP metalloprotease RseP [Proteobacteria bacterium]|jgi:regulator of sigma E protease|nr:RIP metalloprotease RseP [Pseudomonadota bacterium]
MIDFLFNIAGFLVAIAILVSIHEYGHFWVARTLGVKVLRFSVGFGKPLWRKVSEKDGVEYTISAIPLGGYVKMLDENEGEVDPADLPRAFNRQALWKRSLIVLAGPAANFILAICLFAILHMWGTPGLTPEVGQLEASSLASQAGVLQGDRLVSVDGKEYDFWGQHDLYLYNQVIKGQDANLLVQGIDGRRRDVILPLSTIPVSEVGPSLVPGTLGLTRWRPQFLAILGHVVEGSPADRGGLEVSDRVIAIDGQITDQWEHLVSAVVDRPGEELRVLVERDGAELELRVVPEAVTEGGRTFGRIGVAPQAGEIPENKRVLARYGPLQAVLKGVDETWLMSVLTLRMLGKMLTLEVSPKNISGPITIAQYAGQTAQIGLQPFISFLAIISISLGVLNLLPIPMLDGGHLLFYFGEVITRRPTSERVMAMGQQLGLGLLLGLMCLAFYNDIFRLIG